MRLDASQLDFLYRLGKSPDGQQLKSLISAEIADCNVELRKATGESLYRMQGRALYLDELQRHLTVLPSSARPQQRRPMPFDSTA